MRLKTLSLVIWNKMVDDGIYHKTSVYWFPDNLKSIDELWTKDHERETLSIIESVSDRTFVREKGGFGGDFTITLNRDGSYSYYEGLLSSYMGSGFWDVENGKIVMNETGGYEAYFVFALKDGNLVYLDQSSKNFLYVKVEPGDLFVPVDK